MDAHATAPAADPVRTGPWSSIRRKLTAFVAVVVLLTAGALIGSGYLTARRILRDQVDERLSVVAADRQRMLLAYVLLQEGRVARLASRTRLRTLLEELAAGRVQADEFRDQASRSLSDTLAGSANFRSIWVADPAGRVIAATEAADLGRDVSADADFQAGRLGTRLGLPRRDGGTYRALLTAPIQTGAGPPLGVIGVLLDEGPLVQLLADPTGMGRSGEVLVGIPAGDEVRFLLPPRNDPGAGGYPLARVPAMARALAGREGTLSTRDYRGEPVRTAYRPMHYRGWGLVAKIDQAEADAPIADLRQFLIVLGGGVFLIGLLSSYVLARQFTRPILRLADSAAAVAAGDLDAHVVVSSRDELGALGAAFNHMTAELRRSYATLERRVAERTAELEASRDLLGEFFAISTSLQDTDHLEQAFDSVLRFCRRLGYDQAMLSLVDREGGVIRAVRAQGTMAGIVERTVRRLDGPDILAEVVRAGRTLVIADSARDPRCDPETVAAAGVRGQIIVPLINGEVLGTLQVSTGSVVDPAAVDLRPLATLAGQAARALAGLKQLEEIRRLNRHLEDHAQELARSEAKLWEQTRILRSVLDCMGEGVVVADPDGHFVIFNPAAEWILGLGGGDVPPEAWSQHFGIYLPDAATLCPPEDLPLARALRGEAVDPQELFVRHEGRPDGLWVSVTARPLGDGRGGHHGGVAVFRDISTRKRSEQRRAAQHATTRVLAESGTLDEAAPQILEALATGLGWDFGALWRVDQNARLLRCVETWRRGDAPPSPFEQQTRQMTFAPGVGLPGRVWGEGQPAWIDDVTHDASSTRAALADAEGLHAAVGFPIALRGEVLGVIELFGRGVRARDDDLLRMVASLGSQVGLFFERNRMHARVIQSEKLASLGLLSAGVAHEINNPLAYVANNLAVLERDVHSLVELAGGAFEALGAPDAERAARTAAVARLAEAIDFAYIRENLERIVASTRQGAKRVADIVQNLRGFARLDRAAIDRIDIHDAITGSLEMIRGRLGRRNIAVDLRFGDLPSVPCSPAQINQVFLNLLVNAMQALEASRHGDGRIVITTRAEDGAAIVEVADNGGGIPEHVLPRIFDPFFTTKPIGEGTGLGLSITHGIVADHGGHIDVESAPGQGSCFRVVLPLGTKKKERPEDEHRGAALALPAGG